MHDKRRIIMGFYDFTVKDNKGSDVSLDAYKGKVILVINSATECGFTPQYEQLQALYNAFEKDGFTILDFPCDQFGHQAPGSDQEIATFCSSRFGCTFPLFAKIEVNGENELPLFAWLKGEQGFSGFDTANPTGAFMADMLAKMDPDYASKPDIKWNFTKFLVDREGRVVARFEPTDSMDTVAEKVKELL